MKIELKPGLELVMPVPTWNMARNSAVANTFSWIILANNLESLFERQQERQAIPVITDCESGLSGWD